MSYLRSNRVSLRAAASLDIRMPVSTNVQPRMMQEMLCSLIITEALVKGRKAHWVDFAAEEPSSDDGAGEGRRQWPVADDEMFCVRPNEDGSKDWDMAVQVPVRWQRENPKLEQSSFRYVEKKIETFPRHPQLKIERGSSESRGCGKISADAAPNISPPSRNFEYVPLALSNSGSQIITTPSSLTHMFTSLRKHRGSCWVVKAISPSTTSADCAKVSNGFSEPPCRTLASFGYPRHCEPPVH